jgi:hypothetical protein
MFEHIPKPRLRCGDFVGRPFKSIWKKHKAGPRSHSRRQWLIESGGNNGVVLAFLNPKTPGLAGNHVVGHGDIVRLTKDPSSTHAVRTQENPFLSENATAMKKMMTDMMIKPSGDVDRDFVEMMVPHHQGAVDMAKA